MKLIIGYKKKKDEHVAEEDDEIGIKMSVIGTRMTESITKKGKFDPVIPCF